MSARDDYRALASWSGAPYGAAVMEARRALDEIDQLRGDVETLRQAFHRDLAGLRDEVAALRDANYHLRELAAADTKAHEADRQALVDNLEWYREQGRRHAARVLDGDER